MNISVSGSACVAYSPSEGDGELALQSSARPCRNLVAAFFVRASEDGVYCFGIDPCGHFKPDLSQGCRYQGFVANRQLWFQGWVAVRYQEDILVVVGGVCRKNVYAASARLATPTPRETSAKTYLVRTSATCSGAQRGEQREPGHGRPDA